MGGECETPKTGNSTDDISKKDTRMLKYDE